MTRVLVHLFFPVCFAMFLATNAGSQTQPYSMIDQKLVEFSVENRGINPAPEERAMLESILENSYDIGFVDNEAFSDGQDDQAVWNFAKQEVESLFDRSQFSNIGVHNGVEKLRYIVFETSDTYPEVSQLMNLCAYLALLLDSDDLSYGLLSDIYDNASPIADRAFQNLRQERVRQRVKSDIWENATNGKYSPEFLRQLANAPYNHQLIDSVYNSLDSAVLAEDLEWAAYVRNGIENDIKFSIIKAAHDTSNRKLSNIVRKAAELGDQTAGESFSERRPNRVTNYARSLIADQPEIWQSSAPSDG